jgi:hypothetical protein
VSVPRRPDPKPDPTEPLFWPLFRDLVKFARTYSTTRPSKVQIWFADGSGLTTDIDPEFWWGEVPHRSA